MVGRVMRCRCQYAKSAYWNGSLGSAGVLPVVKAS